MLTAKYLVVAEMTRSPLVEYVSKINFKPNTIEYENKFTQKKKRGKKYKNN